MRAFHTFFFWNFLFYFYFFFLVKKRNVKKQEKLILFLRRFAEIKKKWSPKILFLRSHSRYFFFWVNIFFCNLIKWNEKKTQRRATNEAADKFQWFSPHLRGRKWRNESNFFSFFKWFFFLRNIENAFGHSYLVNHLKKKPSKNPVNPIQSSKTLYNLIKPSKTLKTPSVIPI